MKRKIIGLYLVAIASVSLAAAQTTDKTKLDQFFDRLTEKNKAMGSLVIATDGKIAYERSIGYG